MKRTLILVMSLGIATLAHAQATRTWVSGVGDDANPCSRTAPCKTFAGAISKTASPGIINCLDPGGFGAVTITKSITIDCTGTYGSVLASGTQGIVINALSTDRVVLRAIDVNGAGTTLGTNGINVIQASNVSLYTVNVGNFSANGLVTNNTSNNVGLFVSGCQFTTTNNGIHTASTSTGTTRLNVTDTAIENQASIGIDIAGASDTGMVERSILAHNTQKGFQVDAAGGVGYLDSVMITNNNIGISTLVAGTTIRLTRTQVTANSTGISGPGTTKCFGSNVVDGNTAGGNTCTLNNVVGN